MQPRINRQLFTQRIFDSGSLGVLASVIHRFEEPGKYDLTVFRSNSALATRPLVVDGGSDAHQLAIDLASFEAQATRPGDCCCNAQAPLAIAPGGYVLFYASRGRGYAVRAGKNDARILAFDSEELHKDDLFTLSLLEPTHYSVTDRIGGAKARINVHLPAEAPKPVKLPDPFSVDARGTTFEPAEIALFPTQPLIFRIEGNSRIVVEKQVTPSKSQGRVSA